MIDKRAYNEVNEIIKELPKEEQKKIPKVLINTIKSNMDKNYKVNLENIEKFNLLDDTKKILSVIYTDYLSTKEERKVILAKEKSLKK